MIEKMESVESGRANSVRHERWGKIEITVANDDFYFCVSDYFFSRRISNHSGIFYNVRSQFGR